MLQWLPVPTAQVKNRQYIRYFTKLNYVICLFFLLRKKNKYVTYNQININIIIVVVIIIIIKVDSNIFRK